MPPSDKAEGFVGKDAFAAVPSSRELLNENGGLQALVRLGSISHALPARICPCDYAMLLVHIGIRSPHLKHTFLNLGAIHVSLRNQLKPVVDDQHTTAAVVFVRSFEYKSRQVSKYIADVRRIVRSIDELGCWDVFPIQPLLQCNLIHEVAQCLVLPCSPQVVQVIPRRLRRYLRKDVELRCGALKFAETEGSGADATLRGRRMKIAPTRPEGSFPTIRDGKCSGLPMRDQAPRLRRPRQRPASAPPADGPAARREEVARGPDAGRRQLSRRDD
mmetsp:Transcript_61271/g.198188  ORF Transcript_61271/g.198188 Transcript_61271/m.198188 type:complete len:274 (+) Transcript_61271:503-1324(+)